MCGRRVEDGVSGRPGRLIVPAAVLALLLVACSTAPRPRAAEPPAPQPPPEPGEAAALIEAHNRRVELLGRTYSHGVIEFRWVDESGDEHFEPQVNARLWLDLPRQTALRAEKLDEVLLWLGSDDEHYWMFDLMGEERVLYLGRHDEDPARARRSPLLIRPLALLDLLAMTPLPAPQSHDGPAFDAERDAWVVTAPGAGGPMRLYLDRNGGLPVRVETLSRDGAVLMFSSLGRYKSVPVAGVSRAALPRMPTLIDIADPASTVAVKLALDQPGADVDDQPWDRVFALSRLLQALRPQRIEGDVLP
jgi:hypothetical protein